MARPHHHHQACDPGFPTSKPLNALPESEGLARHCTQDGETAEDLRKETVLRNTGLRHVSPLATLDLAEPSARDGRRAGAECPSPFVQKRLKLSFCERNRSRRGTRSEATQATWEARPTAKLSHAELTTEQARSAWTTRRSAWPASLELIADNHARAPQPAPTDLQTDTPQTTLRKDQSPRPTQAWRDETT